MQDYNSKYGGAAIDAQLDKVDVVDAKLTELESEMSILNCNKLLGYSYNSIFTLQEAISAVPANKRYAARGITYLDATRKIHLALFNSNAYASGWENLENWIELSQDLIDTIQSKRFFTPVSTRGYVDFNNTQAKLVVSQNLYYTVKGSLLFVGAGSYTIDFSVLKANYCALVIENQQLSFREINEIKKTDIVIASLVRNGNTVETVCHCVVPFKINGVDVTEGIYNEISRLDSEMEVIAKSIVAKHSNVVRAVVGEVYNNKIDYVAKKGDVLNITLEGNAGLINGNGQLSSGGLILGNISVGQSLMVELPDDITYIRFQRDASNVVGSGNIELIVDVPSSIDNRIDSVEHSLKSIFGNKKISVVRAVVGEVYNNKIDYVAKKGDVLNITLEGNAGLINGNGQLSSGGLILGNISVGQSLMVELPDDITYIRFQRGASNVVGSGNIELIVDYYNTLEERIDSNTNMIANLESKVPDVSTEVQVAASAYDASIRAREEYLRDAYRNSGESEHWYGAEWREESADNVTAINSDGDILLHSLLPIQNKMRRCIIKDGIVQYYLDADNSEFKADGTSAKLDGTDGNVMVEIPEFFYRAEENITDGVRTIRLKISEQGLNGFTFSPKRYTSAYEATLDRTRNKLVSVCTTLFERSTEDIQTESSNYIVGSALSRGIYKTARRSGFTSNATNYRGGVNDATLDNETNPTSQNYSRNQLGLPIANVNRTQCRSYVDNLNGEFIYQYDTHKILWMLAMVEFKKKDVTKGADMSVGANVYPDYNAFEAYFSPQGGISCLPCGITNSLGNKTGTVYYRMVNVPVASTGSSSSIVYNKWSDVWMPCLSYRGVEHWFGHIYKIADGVNILCEGTGTYYEGKEGNGNYEYNNVTYWYQKNPYLTNDKGLDSQKIGTFNFLSGTQVITSIFGGNKLHILPINADVTGYATHYCDSVEIYHRGGMLYPAYNGRLVSNVLDGANFIVGNNLANNGKPRPSDGTRLDIL